MVTKPGAHLTPAKLNNTKLSRKGLRKGFLQAAKAQTLRRVLEAL